MGTTKGFFQGGWGTALLYFAAEREGIAVEDIEVVSMAMLHASGISIHDRKTWYRSDQNKLASAVQRGWG